MTMPSSVSRVRYEGNGTATRFPFSFKVWETSQLAVTLTGPDGKSSEATGWTASLAEDGGTVTYLHEGSPLPEGWLLAITRNMPFTQEIDLVSATRFDPAVMEDGLDVATAERQQLREQLSRSVILPPTSDMSPQEMADRLLDAEKNAINAAQKAAHEAETAGEQADRADAAADTATTQAADAADAARRARAWAESPTPPDPDDPDSKSAKEWARIASDTVPLATASLPGKACFPAPFAVDAQGRVSLRAADTHQNGIVQLTDALDSATGTLAASDTAVKTLNDRLNGLNGSPADRLLWLGVPRPWRSTALPPSHCWANGDFVAFADWPELEQVYAAGGFEGMLMAWDADSGTQAANLGKWRPDAAEPTGLYTPQLSKQFLRCFVGADGDETAGTSHKDTMRPITGQATSYGYYTVSGALAFEQSTSGAANGAPTNLGTIKLDSRWLGANYSGTETVPVHVYQPYIIYLGNPAKETA